MELLNILAIILALSGLFSYINERFLKFPLTIGIMVLGLCLSLLLQLSSVFYPAVLTLAHRVIAQIDFSDILLEFMLSYLLFAGALHTDWNKIKTERGPVMTFATVGVLISTCMIGIGLYGLSLLFGLAVPPIHCFLFGALISPTDPIAVLGILRQSKVPETMEIKIIGESLFNDGIGIVFFLTLLEIAREGVQSISFGQVGLLLIKEIGGGVCLGLLLGYLLFLLLRKFRHDQTEVLLTLALVTGGYALANALHFSGPLAMVAAGLFVGTKERTKQREGGTSEFTFTFWETVDEILNALLFALIGLEVLVIPFETAYILVGICVIVLVIIARYISLLLPSQLAGFSKRFKPHAIRVMTWGGLRGGISVAIALSLPTEMSRSLLLSLTYLVVLFSIIVQALTLQPFIKRLQLSED